MTASFAASQPFWFVVGSRSREFMMHSQIVATLSPPLDRLVNGSMQEARNGKVNWEFVDEDTFICFWQFAYTKTYDNRADSGTPFPGVHEKRSETQDAGYPEYSAQREARSFTNYAQDETTDTAEPVPEPSIWTETVSVGPEPVAAAEELMLEHVVEANDFEARPAPAMKKSGKKKSKETKSSSRQEDPWTRFVQLRKTDDGLASSSIVASSASGARGESLLHAKVYVLADCYGVDPLANLSYTKLHQSLMDIIPSDGSLAGFVALVQYCYETTVPDHLKNMIVLFAASQIKRLRKIKHFERLLDAYAELGKAVLWAVLEKLE